MVLSHDELMVLASYCADKKLHEHIEVPNWLHGKAYMKQNDSDEALKNQNKITNRNKITNQNKIITNSNKTITN